MAVRDTAVASPLAIRDTDLFEISFTAPIARNITPIPTDIARDISYLPRSIPVRITHSRSFTYKYNRNSHNRTNVIKIGTSERISGDCPVDYKACARLNEFGLKLLLSNTMSLAPKIDEIRCCVSNWKPDVACFTETRLYDGINDNHIHIPGYNFITKNRTTGSHGGVCLYIKNSIKFKSLADLHVHDGTREKAENLNLAVTSVQLIGPLWIHLSSVKTN